MIVVADNTTQTGQPFSPLSLYSISMKLAILQRDAQRQREMEIWYSPFIKPYFTRFNDFGSNHFSNLLTYDVNYNVKKYLLDVDMACKIGFIKNSIIIY